jgi:anti-sigma factor RsiW
MEPANLNPPPERDPGLEALLRTAAPSISDDGFSARVLAALPPKATPDRSRVWWCVAGAVAGALFAILRGASWTNLQQGTLDLQRHAAEFAAVAENPWFLLALFLAVGSIVYALYPPRRRLPAHAL